MKPSDSDGLKELTASATGQSKKVAAQGCALQLLAQLYKLTLVEANPTAPVPSKKKQQRPRVSRGFSAKIRTALLTCVLNQ